jgi:hypothetical protein
MQYLVHGKRKNVRRVVEPVVHLRLERTVARLGVAVVQRVVELAALDAADDALRLDLYNT